MTVPLRAVAEVTLGRMRSPGTEHGPRQVPYLRAANVGDGELKLDDIKTMHFEHAEESRYGLAPGDVLVTEASGSRGRVGQTALWAGELGQVMFQNTLLRLRPRPGTDPRFLYWWSRHAYGSGIFAAAAQGLAIWHLGAERLRGTPFPATEDSKQKRVADFLEAQVPLLDQAIKLREHQARLATERHSARVDAFLWDAIGNGIPTRRLVSQIAVGIVIQPAALYTDAPDSVPAVRGNDISPGIIRTDGLVRITREGHLANRRSEIQSGDVLVVRSGLAGAAAQAPEILVGANCVDIVIVRPGPLLTPRYLEHSINSRRGQSAVREHSTGAIQSHFGVEEMKALPIAYRPLVEQRRIGQQLDEETSSLSMSIQALEQSIRYLEERKKSLITAAVTGQFDVTTARSVS